FQAEDGIRDFHVTGVQTCALPICVPARHLRRAVGERVGDQPHRRLRREDEGAAGGVLLEDVVLDGAAELVAGDTRLLRRQLVQRSEERRVGQEGGGPGAWARVVVV